MWSEGTKVEVAVRGATIQVFKGVLSGVDEIGVCLMTAAFPVLFPWSSVIYMRGTD